MKEWKIFFSFVAIFALAYALPLSDPKVTNAILEAFKLLQWYARNHTLACVIPALFISGAIITFLSQASVMKYLGPNSNKLLAYTVASVAGVILAVCSCSVLPMFAGIYALGAGLGPACAFLYSGPAINILAIFLTARVLGADIGIARALGSVAFAFLIGLAMAVIFRRSEQAKAEAALQMPEPDKKARPLWQTASFLGCMMLFLIFSDWFNPNRVVIHTTQGQQIPCVVMQEMRDEVIVQLEKDWAGHKLGEKLTIAHGDIVRREVPPEARTWVITVYDIRWYLAGLMGVLVLLMSWRWLSREEVSEWLGNTWEFSKMLVPILFGGVFIVGFLGALIPEKQVAALVGDNSLLSNMVASLVGALMYFATLTEVPIIQSLMQLGMHKGPALTLLLAGPALSLPSMIAIWKIMGGKKALVFTLLVMAMSTLTGMAFGSWL